MRLIMHFGYDVTCNMSITKFCHFKKKCGCGACKLHFNIISIRDPRTTPSLGVQGPIGSGAWIPDIVSTTLSGYHGVKLRSF